VPRREAEQRGLAIDFSVADMREVSSRHLRPFDVVIACDNSVPHLLSDAEFWRPSSSSSGVCDPAAAALSA